MTELKLKMIKAEKFIILIILTYDRENTAIVDSLINIDDDNDIIDESFYFSELELAED